jgi:hypothetical protein
MHPRFGGDFDNHSRERKTAFGGKSAISLLSRTSVSVGVFSASAPGGDKFEGVYRLDATKP